jgi:hypothetical protein
VSAFICTACGTAFSEGEEDGPPKSCPICDDERQFVPAIGQRWTTHEQLAAAYANAFRRHHPGILSIATAPHFAIGQRAFLIPSPHGNVLWDCISLLDEATVAIVRALGGLTAIAISHPHFYAAMAPWSRAFDAPVFLHEADRRWVCDKGAATVFWEGESRELQPGMTLLRCGGHFAGSTVLHWMHPAEGGLLFCGDTLQVAPDRRHISFMRSYPNLVPLSRGVVERILARLAPYPFEAIYGGFADRDIARGGKDAVRRSAARYLASITGQAEADREGGTG